MLIFRPSTLDDAQAIAACVDVVARERKYLAATQGFSVEQTRSFLSALFETSGAQIIALDQDRVVGWCDVMVLPFEGMRHVGRLGMGLLPEYRGQGWGIQLIRQCLESAFANGLTRIELEVFASNTVSTELYEKMGFVTEGRKRRARILDGTEDDFIVMGLLREEWNEIESRRQ